MAGARVMFAAHTPMRLVGVTGKQVKDGKKRERRRVCVLSFQLQPFTATHASDLSIKARLFAAGDGEPLKDVLSTTLAIATPPQRVNIRLAPDQDISSVELYATLVAPKIVVRRDREGPVYSATINIVSDYPSGDNLLLLMQRVTEQFFVTLETEQGTLLDTAEDTNLVDAEAEDED